MADRGPAPQEAQRAELVDIEPDEPGRPIVLDDDRDVTVDDRFGFIEAATGPGGPWR